MSDEALERFRGFLARRHGAGSHERDVLLHEMGATINRHRLTGQDEGLHSLNTIQLANLVVGQPNWSRDQAFVTGLMLSSLIDGEFDKNFQLSARNLAAVALLPVAGINVYDIMKSDKLVLTTAAIKAIEARFA